MPGDGTSHHDLRQQAGRRPSGPSHIDGRGRQSHPWLIPGQLARGAALQTEIRSAGNDCNRVVRTFQQGVKDGGDVWNAECEGGTTYGIVSKADGTTDVLACEDLKEQTGASCFEKF